MSKTFDELFNEYFGEKPKKKTTKKPRKPKNTKNKSEDIEPLFDINKMYESIVKGLEKKIDDQNKSLSGGTLSLRSMTSIDMNDVDSIKKKFGEPVSVEYFTEDGFSFEKSTYKTENGYYVMVVMKDPNDVPVPKKTIFIFKLLLLFTGSFVFSNCLDINYSICYQDFSPNPMPHSETIQARNLFSNPVIISILFSKKKSRLRNQGQHMLGFRYSMLSKVPVGQPE